MNMHNIDEIDIIWEIQMYDYINYRQLAANVLYQTVSFHLKSIARNVIHFSVIIYILLKCSNNMLQTL